jgi:wyosine [tRNA(Phe)-imidazoG37] synthetase (radical SAM superfamily)
MQIERRAFYEPADILHVVQDKVEEVRNAGGRIDYLTFVPDGEPTLDINLEQEIDLMKSTNIPIAVITNSSLIWQQEVRKALMGADCVSLKIDTVEEEIWNRINRPHGGLQLTSILEGALEFARSFQGRLLTETMMLKGINDADRNFSLVADFLAQIQPAMAYLSIPTRPPAEKWAQPPDGDAINRTYQILKEKVKNVEYLTGYEGNDFASTGNVEENILSITAVHPMRDDALNIFLKQAGADWTVIRRMVMHDQLTETNYKEHTFYLRKFAEPQREEI